MATVIVMVAPRAALVAGAALIGAVAGAFQVPESRVNVFFQEYGPENRYGGLIDTTVIVHALPRPVEVKRTLVRSIADAVVAHLGLRPEQVNIILQETPLDASGVGGVLALDKRAG
jgi:phenylpyruvate tautomerase PptA (4-oxalocrotonate tautomerase family)